MRRILRQVNSRKAAGPEGITGRVMKACAGQLTPVLMVIFNLSLSQCIVPTSFKQSIIVPIPRKPHPSTLNDYRPIALTSVIMKCFERLIKTSITSSIPPPYRSNRSTDNAIAHLLHSTLTHLEAGGGAYARLLFIDYSSAFNTIVPFKLAPPCVSGSSTSSLADHRCCEWASMCHPPYPPNPVPPRGVF